MPTETSPPTPTGRIESIGVGNVPADLARELIAKAIKPTDPQLAAANQILDEAEQNGISVKLTGSVGKDGVFGYKIDTSVPPKPAARGAFEQTFNSVGALTKDRQLKAWLESPDNAVAQQTQTLIDSLNQHHIKWKGTISRNVDGSVKGINIAPVVQEMGKPAGQIFKEKLDRKVKEELPGEIRTRVERRLGFNTIQDEMLTILEKIYSRLPEGELRQRLVKISPTLSTVGGAYDVAMVPLDFLWRIGVDALVEGEGKPFLKVIPSLSTIIKGVLRVEGLVTEAALKTGAGQKFVNKQEARFVTKQAEKNPGSVEPEELSEQVYEATAKPPKATPQAA